MKRLISVMMILVMLFGTTVYAKDEKDIDKIRLRANGENIEFEIEGQIHEIGCRCLPDPEVKMIFEEDFDSDGKKLYFRVKWKTETTEEVDIENYYIPPRKFAVPLRDATGDEVEMSLKLEFEKMKLEETTTYSLWLVGGDDYKDNFLKGKKDVLLRDDFVVYQMPEEKMPTEVFLTVGKETIQYKGEEKHILEPIVFNKEGRILIAAKDVGMIMEGAQTVGFNILWNKDTRTVTLQMGARTISMSEGNHRWLYQGHEMYTETVPEIRNGIMYLPLREMANIFNYQTIQWDAGTETVRLYKN
ncbi:copper amine oxidase N-terminal domain-containing protein [Anaerotignum sp.]